MADSDAGSPRCDSEHGPAAGKVDETHSDFGSVLLDFLRGSASRCVLPIVADISRPNLTALHVEGVNPAIWIRAHDDGMIGIGVEWESSF